MSYASARERIVAIIEAAVPASLPLGLGSRFKEAPDASDESPPSWRQFTLFGVEDRVAQPLSTTRRRVASLVLTVYYPLATDRKALDLALRSDHKDIGDALLLPSNWQQSTSTIVSILGLPVGPDSVMSAAVEVEGDVVRHVYGLEVFYVS